MTDRTLLPVIVHDARTGRVLMLAWADDEAIEATRRTGEAHFWSRSRNELWRKGATSGNTMAVRRIHTDCDGDTYLYEVDPAGPACHTGTETCFTEPYDSPAQGFTALEGLWATIASRIRERTEGSYTVALVDAGTDAVARKVVEEAAEVAFAAKDHAAGDAGEIRVAEEAGDLIYHLLVLLAERAIDPSIVVDVLAGRAESLRRPSSPGA